MINIEGDNKNTKNDYDIDYVTGEVTKYCNEVFKEENALFLAVDKCEVEIVKLLLSINEIDVNFISTLIEYKHKTFPGSTLEKYEYHKRKCTALHLATYKGYSQIIKLLLNHKNINININANNGKKTIEIFNNFSLF